MQEDFVLGDSIWHNRTALQKEFKPHEQALWWQRPLRVVKGNFKIGI